MMQEKMMQENMTQENMMQENMTQEKITPHIHQMCLSKAQLLIDETISFFKGNFILTNPEMLPLVHELRSVLDSVEQDLLSSPDRPFHADGHEQRMKQLQSHLGAPQKGIL